MLYARGERAGFPAGCHRPGHSNGGRGNISLHHKEQPPVSSIGGKETMSGDRHSCKMSGQRILPVQLAPIHHHVAGAGNSISSGLLPCGIE
ncbi:MAG: hypothetical protein J7L69_11150 [Desulfobulbaceae bacterium]|nr:hypothetical protein [Desulfobulbaceae bacterium]